MKRLLLRALALAVVLGTCPLVQADDQRYKRYYEEAYVIKGSNPGAAKAKLRKVLELAPPDSDYAKKAKRLLHEIEQSGDDGHAEEQADAPVSPLPAAPARGPDQARANELRKQGTQLYKQGNYDASVRAYRKALKLNPQDHELHRLIGSVSARMGRRKEAYKAYKIYVKRCPNCMYAPTIKKILKDYDSLQYE